MPKIILQGHIIVPPAELDSIQKALATHIDLTRAEAGCLRFSVMQCPDNPCQFNVYEAFDSQASFDAHQQRVRQSDWGQVSANVSRHYRISQV